MRSDNHPVPSLQLSRHETALWRPHKILAPPLNRINCYRIESTKRLQPIFHMEIVRRFPLFATPNRDSRQAVPTGKSLTWRGFLAVAPAAWAVLPPAPGWRAHRHQRRPRGAAPPEPPPRHWRREWRRRGARRCEARPACLEVVEGPHVGSLPPLCSTSSLPATGRDGMGDGGGRSAVEPHERARGYRVEWRRMDVCCDQPRRNPLA
jgi:hypothetical protein